MKKKSREWQVRLLEEIKENKKGYFVTLTLSNESIKKLDDIIQEEENQLMIEYHTEGYERDNAIATKATRLFLERWRKFTTKSARHWLITELGHQGTENIHLHGIIWTDLPKETIERHWKYGYVWTGHYINEKTINYITKYVTKVDKIHKYYKPKILNSKGIGKAYTQTYNSKLNTYKEKNTDETYKTRNGYKMAMPIYYRNKIYTEKEREQLWLQKLDKQIRYVGGEKIDISQNEDQYWKLLKWYQNKNKSLGYGDNTENWEQKEYEKQRRNMMRDKRKNNKKNK